MKNKGYNIFALVLALVFTVALFIVPALNKQDIRIQAEEGDVKSLEDHAFKVAYMPTEERRSVFNYLVTSEGTYASDSEISRYYKEKYDGLFPLGQRPYESVSQGNFIRISDEEIMTFPFYNMTGYLEDDEEMKIQFDIILVNEETKERKAGQIVFSSNAYEQYATHAIRGRTLYILYERYGIVDDEVLQGRLITVDLDTMETHADQMVDYEAMGTAYLYPFSDSNNQRPAYFIYQMESPNLEEPGSSVASDGVMMPRSLVAINPENGQERTFDLENPLQEVSHMAVYEDVLYYVTTLAESPNEYVLIAVDLNTGDQTLMDNLGILPDFEMGTLSVANGSLAWTYKENYQQKPQIRAYDTENNENIFKGSFDSPDLDLSHSVVLPTYY